MQVLEGENAVQKNRNVMGATNPKEADEGTIRKEYALSLEANSVHGSDTEENANVEGGSPNLTQREPGIPAGPTARRRRGAPAPRTLARADTHALHTHGRVKFDVPVREWATPPSLQQIYTFDGFDGNQRIP